MSEKKQPHTLVSHRNENGGWDWECESCNQVVHRVAEGEPLYRVTKAQTEHECPNDVAKAMLPHHLDRIKKLLGELEVVIRIHWTDYETAELELMDVKTCVTVSLGGERLS